MKKGRKREETEIERGWRKRKWSERRKRKEEERERGKEEKRNTVRL